MNYPYIELKKKRYSELSHSRWAKLHLKIQLILKNYSIHLSMNFFFFSFKSKIYIRNEWTVWPWWFISLHWLEGKPMYMPEINKVILGNHYLSLKLPELPFGRQVYWKRKNLNLPSSYIVFPSSYFRALPETGY